MTVSPRIAIDANGLEAVAELRRRRELAHFLVTRRERLTPQASGFVVRGRRRVEGLRREEVAEMAGISASWYTWLEQGRKIRVSAETLERLAGALRLSEDEREQLYNLAGIASTPRALHGDETAPPELKLLLDKFDPWPAFVVCSRWDVVAWNRGAVRLFGDFEALPWRERNFLWLLFTRPAFRALFVDQDRMVRCVMGHFRAEFSGRLSDTNWVAFVRALEQASLEFHRLWNEHTVVRSPDWRKEMSHPELGALAFETITLVLPPNYQLRVLFYRPADAITERAFGNTT